MEKVNLKSLWIQGLLMAVVIAAALPVPDLALAQLSATAQTSKTSVFAPILMLLSFAAYVIGGVLVISGIMKIKHHTENQTSTPLSHGIARLGAGSVLLALPYLMGLANQTASSTMQNTSTFQQFTF
jgi:hypothetical protein